MSLRERIVKREGQIRKVRAKPKVIPSRVRRTNKVLAREQLAKFIIGNALKSFEGRGAFIWIPEMREQLKHGAPATFTIGHLSSMTGINKNAVKELLGEIIQDKEFQKQLTQNKIKITQGTDKKFYITKIK